MSRNVAKKLQTVEAERNRRSQRGRRSGRRVERGGGTKYDRYNGEAHIFTLEPTALPTLQAPSEPN